MVENIAHKYTSKVTAPTCTENCCTTHTCTDCGSSYTSDIVTAPGHNYDAVVTAPTCLDGGYSTYTCTRCGNGYVGDIVEALGHDIVYTDRGQTHGISCKRCDYAEEQAHDFIKNACFCGTVREYFPDEDLKFSMNISAGAEMLVNYSFTAVATGKYTDFYLEVKKDVADGEPIVTTYDRSDFDCVIHPGTGVPLIYNAAYTGINAKEMGDNFTATLYALDEKGNVYRGQSTVSSIKDFLLGKLNDPNAIDEMKTMAVDMLRYGATAQFRFDYNTENIVTQALSKEQLAYATKSSPKAEDHSCVTGDGAGVSTNITVGAKVELNLSCISTIVSDPTAVKCVITDEEGNILSELATSNMTGVMFSAKYDNVGARQMRQIICATFYDGDTPISKTVKWSVESYVAQVRAKTDATIEEIALVEAMLTYGDSVAAYLTVSGL